MAKGGSELIVLGEQNMIHINSSLTHLPRQNAYAGNERLLSDVNSI